jgi:hypothetical protein
LKVWAYSVTEVATPGPLWVRRRHVKLVTGAPLASSTTRPHTSASLATSMTTLSVPVLTCVTLFPSDR